jgi:hypothetical protein
MTPWLVRPSQPCDLDFIEAVFCRSLHAYGDRPAARALANKLAPQCLIASTHDDPTVALGLACYDADTIHLAFVKAAFRRMGIFKSLVSARKFKFYSLHVAGSGEFVRAKKLRFNPLRLMVKQ